jgi:hypothetical protein
METLDNKIKTEVTTTSSNGEKNYKTLEGTKKKLKLK